MKEAYGLDHARRLCIPTTLRSELDLKRDNLLHIYADTEGHIIITKKPLNGFLGVTRGLDGLGRIVIPHEYLDYFGYNPGQKITFNLQGDKLVLSPIN